MCFVVKEAGIVDSSCRTLFFSMTPNTVYVGRVRGNITLAKHNRARIVCVCVSGYLLCILHFTFPYDYMWKVYICLCGGMMMIKCLWFCGINGLFTKTVNKRK